MPSTFIGKLCKFISRISRTRVVLFVTLGACPGIHLGFHPGSHPAIRTASPGIHLGFHPGIHPAIRTASPGIHLDSHSAIRTTSPGIHLGSHSALRTVSPGIHLCSHSALRTASPGIHPCSHSALRTATVAREFTRVFSRVLSLLKPVTREFTLLLTQAPKGRNQKGNRQEYRAKKHILRNTSPSGHGSGGSSPSIWLAL